MKLEPTYARLALFLMTVAFQSGCTDDGPIPDTTASGYITVFLAPAPGNPNARRELLLLSNGDYEVELVANEKTKWINATGSNSGQIIDFDSIYRAEGALNYVPDSLLDETGKVTRVGFADMDWIWLSRIERLSEQEAGSLLADGTVQPKS